MAINDVSLTAGMRSNLLSLQATVDLLDRTQTRLSTGKKVNSAIDNPVSFFASQALTSRASVIDSLKDAMGQAVQTITAADKGIKAISAMIEQAKGIAQSAQSAEAGSTPTAFSGNVSNAITYSTMSVTFGAIADAETITIDGEVFTVLTVGADSTAGEFGSMAELLDAINENTTLAGGDYEFAVVGGNLIISNATDDVADTVVAGTVTGYAESVGTAHSETITAVITGDNNPGTYTGTAATTALAAAALKADIEAETGVNVATVTIVDGATTGTVGVTFDYEASDELTSLQAQYNAMLTQIDDLAADSGYKGKNLLNSDLLTVKFEGTHQLDVQGFDASTAGDLAIASATWTTAGTGMDASITELDNALVTLRSESSKLAGNLSIITVRQEFSTNMISTLIEGADKLTLADSNEEGANMLMLQTRQTLASTALSLSAQAAQSVLRLFQ